MSSIVFPDVCKTPSPGGPVPIPYPIIGPGSDPKPVQRPKVKGVDADFSQHMKNLQAANQADAAASAGGVAAARLKGKAVGFLSHSFNVKVEGATAAVLLGRGLVNHATHKPPAAAAPAHQTQSKKLR